MKCEIVVGGNITDLLAAHGKVAEATNAVLDSPEMLMWFEDAQLPPLKDDCRIHNFIGSGFNYQAGGKENQLDVKTAPRGKKYALVIYGAGRCESIARFVADEVSKDLPKRVEGQVTYRSQ